jgi:hypothetical protein
MLVASATDAIRTEDKLLKKKRKKDLILSSTGKYKWPLCLIINTWTVLSNHRLMVFQWLPPPWIICRSRLVSTRWLTSSSSTPERGGRNGWSMQTIMLDDSIDCSERALIKSTHKREKNISNWMNKRENEGVHSFYSGFDLAGPRRNAWLVERRGVETWWKGPALYIYFEGCPSWVETLYSNKRGKRRKKKDEGDTHYTLE